MKSALYFDLHHQTHATHPLIRWIAVSGSKYGKFLGDQALNYLTYDNLESIQGKITKMSYWTDKHNPLLLHVKILRSQTAEEYLEADTATVRKSMGLWFKTERTPENPDGDLW